MTEENKTRGIWNSHYTKDKSRLKYPDENLVRMLSVLKNSGEISEDARALDFGAGSGRHSILLNDFGLKVSACDYSENSILQIKEIGLPLERIIIINEPPYPFSENEFQLIVSWGVLHYNSIENIAKILNEYRRILKKGGWLLGTIRAIGDSHLSVSSGKIGIEDIKGAGVKLFDLEELKLLLKDFENLEFGYMERSPVGRINERICHWIFKARK